MIKRLLIIGAIGMACAAAQAETLTPQQALQRAMGEMPARMHAVSDNQVQPALLYTSYAQGEPTLYVFEGADSQGYMVLSADDVAVPVLGYADQGTIDPENMPDGLKYWLEFLQDEIEQARINGVQPASRSNAPAYAPGNWQAIAPLCSTKWDQSSPYNDLCPSKNGKRAVTGCVATAMAQMMKYHNYPDVGQGSATNGSWAPITIDFSEMHYDWANMLDTYGRGATAQQKTAVAELMVSCGVAVNMNYSASESGAYSRDIPGAYIKYFNYDKNCHFLDRIYFPLTQWQEMIYNELKNVGPVVYAGQASGGGHCFVCDGYDKNGYFHFNWGWGGMSDGYYVLTALTPGSQGIGGASSSDGFNSSQCIILGAKRPVAGSDYYYQMYSSSGLKISQPNSTLGSSISLTNTFVNGSVPAITGSVGLKATKADGSSIYIVGKSFSNLSTSFGVNNITVQLPTSLTSGTYTLTPAWMNAADEKRYDVLTPINSVRSYTMTVNGNNVTFKADTYSASVQISDIKLDIPAAYYNKRLIFSAKATNNSGSEFYNTIKAALYTDKSAVSGSIPDFTGQDFILDVESGSTETFDYTVQFSGAQPGDYTMRFINTENNAWLSDAYTLTIQPQPNASNTKLKVTDFGFRNQPNLNQVDPVNMVIGFDIQCEKGYFDGRLQVGINEEGYEYWRESFQTSQIMLFEGWQDQVLFTGSTTALRTNRVYQMALYNGDYMNSNTRLTDFINFYVEGSTVGIEGIEADAEPAAVEMYNLQGIKVDAETATPGMYIKVAKFADGSSRTTRVYVK